MAYLALEIIVTGKEETARHGRGHRGDAAENRFGLENIVSIRWGGRRKRGQLTP